MPGLDRIVHAQQVRNEQHAASTAFVTTFPAPTVSSLPTGIYQRIGQRSGILNRGFLFAMILPCFETTLRL